MKIPFTNKSISRPAMKPRAKNPSSDTERIQRELDYRKRVGVRNPRIKKLQERARAQNRRTYGEE